MSSCVVVIMGLTTWINVLRKCTMLIFLFWDDRRIVSEIAGLEYNLVVLMLALLFILWVPASYLNVD